MQINNTLLQRLFLAPNPQPEKEEVITYFKKLYNRMFPNPDDYIDFLKAQNTDRQYECAERAIHRLCYHANFPPSYYALLDVICVEEYQKRTVSDTDSYIPRDHFIHIVYLYLLGIYVFFYNSEFYTRIISANRFERCGPVVINVKYNCIKDFISEWKYFCLYHDIGYSAEILGNLTKFPNRKKTYKELKNSSGGYKASLEKNAILKQQTYFGTLEIISKLLFTKLVISNSTEKISPTHKIFRNFKQSKLTKYYTNTKEDQNIAFEHIPESYLSGTQLEKIYSNHCLKKLLPTIDLKDITIIGLEKDFGYLGFVTYLEENTRIFIYPDRMKSSVEFLHLLEMPNMVLYDDYSPKDFEFIYILNKSDIENRISSIARADYYESVYIQIERQFENNYKEISDESHFIDFPYTIYYWLFTKLKSKLNNTKLDAYLETQTFSFSTKSQVDITKDLLRRSHIIHERILDSLEGYYPLLFDKCNELLRSLIDREISCPIKSSSPSNMIKSYIEQYLQVLSKIKQDEYMQEILYTSLSGELLTQIEEEIDLLQLFSQVFVQLKCTLDKSDSYFEYNYITGETEIPTFLEENISEKLKEKMSMPNISSVYQDYKLQYGNTVDHGIISAQYAASVFSCYHNALTNAHHDQEQLLLSVLLDIPNGIEDSRIRYIDNYHHVFTNVLFSVFAHNLYPSCFRKNSKGAEYKTKISDPFTYLALLCDALQEWNRPHSLHPVLFESHPSNGVSESYDIVIRDNCIYLSDISSESVQKIDYIISSLDTYMANIKAFLKHKYGP